MQISLGFFLEGHRSHQKSKPNPCDRVVGATELRAATALRPRMQHASFWSLVTATQSQWALRRSDSSPTLCVGPPLHRHSTPSRAVVWFPGASRSATTFEHGPLRAGPLTGLSLASTIYRNSPLRRCPVDGGPWCPGEARSEVLPSATLFFASVGFVTRGP